MGQLAQDALKVLRQILYELQLIRRILNDRLPGGDSNY